MKTKRWRNASMVWEVRYFPAESQGLRNALAKGWEPFGVSTDRGKDRVWVRRSRWS